MTGWTNYVAFVKANNEEIKETLAKDLDAHRTRRYASEQYNSIMSRSYAAENIGNTARASELRNEANRLRDNYNNGRKF